MSHTDRTDTMTAGEEVLDRAREVARKIVGRVEQLTAPDADTAEHQSLTQTLTEGDPAD